jgi:hypothetical protein
MNSATQNSSKMRPTEASEAGISDHQRAALSWALGAYLGADAVAQAVAMWSPPVGAQSSALAGLSRYCRAVARQFNLPGKEAELHLRIIRGMQARSASALEAATPPQATQMPQAEQAPLFPSDALPAHSANDSVPAGLPSAAVQRFLEAIEASVARECPERYSPQQWRQTLMRHAQRLPRELLGQVADWLWGHTNVLLGDWPARGTGTRLINAAYVTLAEWLGPVRADACFTAIVREFENSQDPVLMSVRRYL